MLGMRPDAAPASARITADARWARVRDSGIGILVWLVIIATFFWALGHVARTVLVLVMAALLAYAVTPAVRWLRRWLPNWLAITLVYLAALAVIAGFGSLLVGTAVVQLVALAKSLPSLLQPSTPRHPSPIAQALQPFGISAEQVSAGRAQVLAAVERAAGSIAERALPLLTGVTTTLLDLVLIFVLSIYLVVDGPRLVAWMRTAAPAGRMRGRVQFFVDLVQRNVGGYIRGQFLLAVLIGVLVGLGMAVFRVPYALLLGVLAFVLEFIPILGTLVSGAICVLIAVPTRGVLIAVLVLAYFVIVHIIEGDVVGPRIVGRVLGLHPVVAILALLAGSELFGIWGALFASPVAGVIQTVVMTAWSEWRTTAEEQAPVSSDPRPDRRDRPPGRWMGRRAGPPANSEPADQTAVTGD